FMTRFSIRLSPCRLWFEGDLIMKRKVPTILVVILAGLVLTSGALLAQKASQHPASTRHVYAEFSDAGGSQGWMGVRLSEVTADKARELKLSDQRGAVVGEAEP